MAVINERSTVNVLGPRRERKKSETSQARERREGHDAREGGPIEEGERASDSGLSPLFK